MLHPYCWIRLFAYLRALLNKEDFFCVFCQHRLLTTQSATQYATQSDCARWQNLALLSIAFRCWVSVVRLLLGPSPSACDSRQAAFVESAYTLDEHPTTYSHSPLRSSMFVPHGWHCLVSTLMSKLMPALMSILILVVAFHPVPLALFEFQCLVYLIYKVQAGGLEAFLLWLKKIRSFTLSRFEVWFTI